MTFNDYIQPEVLDEMDCAADFWSAKAMIGIPRPFTYDFSSIAGFTEEERRILRFAADIGYREGQWLAKAAASRINPVAPSGSRNAGM